ncbi:ABC-2 family transporter protein [Candidatus Falkowbacteria bacterium]|nr:ABC-2 family transporter protein [Candidatus Falkowbacteria bacterium]
MFKKYWTIFKISWQRQLVYRFNFFLWRLRHIIGMLLLYFLWSNLTANFSRFAGYSSSELFTYVFAANILRSIVFGPQSREAAEEITSGWFSKYLIMPVNHFGYNFCREAAERVLNFLSSLVEVFFFIFIFKPPLIFPKNFETIIIFLVASAIALFLYYILSYLISLFSFWSSKASMTGGVRFLYEWFLEMLSGAYFPLDILFRPFFLLAAFTPFLYLIYLPLSIFINKYSSWQIVTGITLQIIWIVAALLAVKIVWRKGLKRYSGEGI